MNRAGRQPLYRGVPETSPLYPDAVQGLARPHSPNGHMDPLLHHTRRSRDSAMTSWSTDRAKALRFATDGGDNNGVILQLRQKDVRGRTKPSDDFAGEKEILVTEPVRARSVESVRAGDLRR